MRVNQRKLRPFSSQSRNLDIVHITDTIESSATLAAGEDTVFSMTTASKKGIPIFVQEDISLFETSIAEANLIPNGASITTSNYQIIGPWREQVDGDEKNIVSKIYIRNASVATADFSKKVLASLDDGLEIAGWTSNGTTNTVGAAAADEYTSGFRFNSVTIPQGSTINTATLKLNPANNDADSVLTKIYGIDEDDTADFTNDPTGRDKTTAVVDWDFGNVTADVVVTSPDISAIVEEIVGRGGWSSGNDMGFLIFDDGSVANDNISFDTWDEDPAKAAQLDVNYDVAGSSKTILFRGRTRYVTPRRDVTIT